MVSEKTLFSSDHGFTCPFKDSGFLHLFRQVKVNHFSSVSKWHIVAVVNHIFSYMNTLKLLFNFIILNHIVQITNIMFCDSILLQDDRLKKNTQTCHGLKCVTCLEVNLPFYNLTELK